ncbi:FKBP-type peptidyl-prolyl cis-trans isomerase [Natrialbaceae archaeon AArc-T1-2]|uniref:FKBP-type peptidyl-prolyl cis-trans isomerase n=1 Tax=Natrialbaceae archaeon AArc-T1-2 TaxID=3053904 RepID=UPI00255AA8E5|nr:peptidylprolyl isomerase [Natrialbaceae archaeon AArc-T1-2]WIV65992.1 peptidylprolyl isomerase [Natrialbaceae archaeon AArc-T1-2]
MTIATGDSVTIEYTGRTEEGAVFDTTRESVARETGLADSQPDREYDPLTVEIGEGRVIKGLEDALVGLEQGATPTVTIPPEEGYGEWSEEQVQEFETEELRQMLGGELPEEGSYLETQDGVRGEITDVGDDIVRVDFNSPLAGETIEFDVEILAVN